MLTITKRSVLTGAVHTRTIDVTTEQLDAYENGVLIQDAMPHLSLDDREFILSGSTPEEWEAVFGDEDYED